MNHRIPRTLLDQLCDRVACVDQLSLCNLKERIKHVSQLFQNNEVKFVVVLNIVSNAHGDKCVDFCSEKK